MRPVARNTDFGVPEQVRHKTSCPATGNGKVPGISHLLSRGIVLSIECTCSENKGADQL